MRARQMPAKSFCSIPVSPQFPATPLIPLLWESKPHLDLERLLSPFHGLGLQAGLQQPKCQSTVRVNVKPFKLKRGSLPVPSPCLVLGFPVLGTDVHVARVDKSNSCLCLLARSRSMAAANYSSVANSFGFWVH